MNCGELSWLHISLGIAERFSESAQLLRTAVMVGFRSHLINLKGRQRIEKRVSRLNVEKVLGDAVVH